MNVCAITMVYQDYFALSQWVRHYSEQLGIENLFIVAHGADEKVAEIARGANIWTIPRDNLERFDRRRNWMLNKFQAGLLKFYDWVIRTDTDELICVTPDHTGIRGFLGAQDADVVFAIGMDLFEAPEDADIDANASVFDQRSNVVITGNYSKAFAVRKPVPLMRHGAAIKPQPGEEYSHVFSKDAFLVHLKFASMTALEDANETRKALGRSDLPGMPGLGWQKATNHSRRFFDTALSMEVMPWEEAIDYAHDCIVSDLKFSDHDGVIRAPGNPHITRTNLPAWFRTDGSDQ